MVNNSVNLFEKGKIILDGSDKTMISELEEYRIKNITSAGLPQYTDENEHAIDAMNLCLLSFALHYDSLLRKVYSTKAVFIPGVGEKRDDDIKSRSIGEEEEEKPNKIPPRSLTSVNSSVRFASALSSASGVPLHQP